MWSELKTIQYILDDMPDDVNQNHFVVYSREGNNIIFSGIRTENRTSTINASVEIIQAISEAEGVEPQECVFYDLSTHLGYGGVLGSFKPGEYEFGRLVVNYSESRPAVSRWVWGRCSSKVEQLFKEQIGQPEEGGRFVNKMHTPAVDSVELPFLI